MFENPAYTGALLVGVAIALSLIYLAYQIHLANIRMRADTLYKQINTRLQIWNDQLDKVALRSAREKMFEHELYRQDSTIHELDQLTLAEKNTLIRSLVIELLYFQGAFYQRKHNMIEPDQVLPLDQLRFLSSAPNRRHWKDMLRIGGHFPQDYVRHVDALVKKYDEMERRMDEDQDADYQALTQRVFDISPPPWLD